jgi:hypothetical protein
MNKKMYLIIGVLFLGLIAYFIFRPKNKSILDNYFISTQGQSDERVSSLNLDKASEDASYILDTNKLSIPQVQKETDEVDYKADPERDWIINLKQVNGGLFKKEDLSKTFDTWRSEFQSEIYGFSPEDKRWTFVFAGGSPETYEKIQVAINLQGVYNEETPTYDPKKLEQYVLELEKRIKNYPAKLKLEQTETVDDAVAKAELLVELYQEFNRDAIIVLQKDNGFKGIEVWDALQSVGLKWGDGDLFHWDNNSKFGGDQHFSVWTTTEPGYFLPEQIKDGVMNPENLVFGFSIPRSADPIDIFEMMLNSTKYCQKRLGGTILNKNGEIFNEENERKELGDLITKMKAKGIVTGSDKALVMY